MDSKIVNLLKQKMGCNCQGLGTFPRVGNVTQPPLRKDSGERGPAGRTHALDRFSLGNQACIVPRPL